MQIDINQIIELNDSLFNELDWKFNILSKMLTLYDSIHIFCIKSFDRTDIFDITM